MAGAESGSGMQALESERPQAAYYVGPSTLPWHVGFHGGWHGKPLVGSGKTSVRTDMKSKSYSTAVLNIGFRGQKQTQRPVRKNFRNPSEGRRYLGLVVINGGGQKRSRLISKTETVGGQGDTST